MATLTCPLRNRSRTELPDPKRRITNWHAGIQRSMGYAAEALIGQQLSCATARANDGSNKQRISTKATRSIMGFPNLRPSAATCEPAMARQGVGLGAVDQHRDGFPTT